MKAVGMTQWQSSQNKDLNEVLEKFLEVYIKVLDKHAPCEQNFLRGNHSSFMNWGFSKAVTTIRRLWNKFFKEKAGNKL